MINELFDTALWWIQRGISVIPIGYMSKKPELPWEPYQRTLPTEQEISSWFASRLHNVGVVMGWKNLVVIDFDDARIYTRWSLWATKKNGIASQFSQTTHQVQTARGMHLYAFLPHTEQNRKLDGIDIKAQRSYVLAPPSIHPSGAHYRLIRGGLPMNIKSLSDVLPPDLLTSHTELASGVSLPKSFTLPDPWSALNNADTEPGKHLIEAIRNKFRVEDFFPDAMTTSSSSRWLMTTCPFHEDNHPSFWIDTANQICGCHAGCTPRPLDVINLYGRLNGLSNLESIWMMKRML